MSIKPTVRGWTLLLFLMAGLAPPVTGQLPPVRDTLRGKRVLAVANLAFFEAWEPNVTVGFLGQISLDRMAPTVEDGVTTYSAPSWYAHALATGGIRTEGEVLFSAYGEAGIVRRRDAPGFFTSFGLAGFYNLEPQGYGAVFRSDLLMDNAFAQVGLIRFKDTKETGFYLGFGFMRCLLKDLEFTDSCIGG